MVVMFLPENRTMVLTCLRRKNSILHTKCSFMWKLENVNKTFVLIIRNKTVVYQYKASKLLQGIVTVQSFPQFVKGMRVSSFCKMALWLTAFRALLELITRHVWSDHRICTICSLLSSKINANIIWIIKCTSSFQWMVKNLHGALTLSVMEGNWSAATSEAIQYPGRS